MCFHLGTEGMDIYSSLHNLPVFANFSRNLSRLTIFYEILVPNGAFSPGLSLVCYLCVVTVSALDYSSGLDLSQLHSGTVQHELRECLKHVLLPVVEISLDMSSIGTDL